MPDYIGMVVIKLKVPITLDHTDDPQDPDFYEQRNKAVTYVEEQVKLRLNQALTNYDVADISFEVIEPC